MVFVIAAEEMPLKAKSADNIIASFLRIFVLKKKKKKGYLFWHAFPLILPFTCLGSLKLVFSSPQKY